MSDTSVGAVIKRATTQQGAVQKKPAATVRGNPQNPQKKPANMQGACQKKPAKKPDTQVVNNDGTHFYRAPLCPITLEIPGFTRPLRLGSDCSGTGVEVFCAEGLGVSLQHIFTSDTNPACLAFEETVLRLPSSVFKSIDARLNATPLEQVDVYVGGPMNRFLQ